VSKLTVTSKGQVTLKKDILEHLGVSPGAQINVEKLPDGRIEVRAAPAGEIRAVFGLLKQKNGPRLSIEQMNEITRQGWSGRSGKK
jgi:AbrB family looped-hinge helix DNA binding protein